MTNLILRSPNSIQNKMMAMMNKRMKPKGKIDIFSIVSDPKIANVIITIASDIQHAGGQAFFVGGCVRDFLFKRPIKDVDIAVEGLGLDDLNAILCRFGDTKTTGTDFLVIKIKIEGQEFDFSATRDEASTGDGFKDVIARPASLFSDLRRRDITINAIAVNVLSGDLIDPFNGTRDAHGNIIRHTSDKFIESSERPLRIAQFLARMPFLDVAADTTDICASMADKFATIPKEQLKAQFEKMLERGIKPSRGFRFLQEIGFIDKLHGFADLIGLEQDAIHHPEGDALTHTLMATDAMARICQREGIDGFRRFKLVLAALTHDMGKPQVTIIDDDGRITSRGHAFENDAALAFLDQICIHQGMQRAIIALVNHHMSIMQNHITIRVVRRIARKLNEAVGSSIDIRKAATPQDLCFLFEADKSARREDGQVVLIGQTGKIGDFRDTASELDILDNNRKPPAMINGKDLIALGLTPGPLFGKILSAVKDAEDSGEIGTKQAALDLAQKMIDNQ